MKARNVAIVTSAAIVTVSVASMAYIEVSNAVLTDAQKCHRFWMSASTQKRCDDARFAAEVDRLNAEQDQADAALERTENRIASQQQNLADLQRSINDVARRHP